MNSCAFHVSFPYSLFVALCWACSLCSLLCSRDGYNMNKRQRGSEASKQCSVPAQYWTASCNINIINIGRTLAPSSCWSRHTGSTTLGARELCKLSDTIIPDWFITTPQIDHKNWTFITKWTKNGWSIKFLCAPYILISSNEQYFWRWGGPRVGCRENYGNSGQTLSSNLIQDRELN